VLHSGDQVNLIEEDGWQLVNVLIHQSESIDIKNSLVQIAETNESAFDDDTLSVQLWISTNDSTIWNKWKQIYTEVYNFYKYN